MKNRWLRTSLGIGESTVYFVLNLDLIGLTPQLGVPDSGRGQSVKGKRGWIAASASPPPKKLALVQVM